MLAVPSQTLRSVLRLLDSKVTARAGLVNLAKGVETTTLKRMSEIIAEELNPPLDRVATVSGPSHAEEVVLDMPTTVVAAGTGTDFIVERRTGEGHIVAWVQWDDGREWLDAYIDPARVRRTRNLEEWKR